jgi:hypothetical protein
MRLDYTGECDFPAGTVLGSMMAFITIISVRKIGVIQTKQLIWETGVSPLPAAIF